MNYHKIYINFKKNIKLYISSDEIVVFKALNAYMANIWAKLSFLSDLKARFDAYKRLI